MALLYLEGFDWLDSTDLEADGYGLLQEKIGTESQDPVLTIESSAGRNGSDCLKVDPVATSNPNRPNNFQGVIITNPSPSSGQTVIFGFAVKLEQFYASATTQEFCQVRNVTGGIELFLSRNQTGQVCIGYGEGSENIYTSASFMGNDIWYYIECKVNLASGTSGNVRVRLNGVEIIAYTSQDTLINEATPTTILLGMTNWESGDKGDVYFDDFYLADDSGSDNNDFLGDVQVQTLTPNGNGNTSDWTGSDADSTDNYLHVDENPPDDDTSYVEDNTSTNKDLFTYTNLSNASSVFGCQAKTIAKKVDAGAANIKNVCRSNTTETDSAELGINTDYQGVASMYETDPDTGSLWGASAVDSAEFGVKVV